MHDGPTTAEVGLSRSSPGLNREIASRAWTDRAVWVEGRRVVGFTLNFGSVWSWLLLLTSIVLPRLLHYLSTG
jgi:hypothetical protein